MSKFYEMGRILAFDVGRKRTGIAVTDPLKIIASGLTTVATGEIIGFLDAYLRDEDVELFIVGEPKQMNYQASESEVFIAEFIQKLKNTYPAIPIERIDERFTSKMAAHSLFESGMKKNKRKNKALLDEVSATLILQSYLTKNNI